MTRHMFLLLILKSLYVAVRKRNLICCCCASKHFVEVFISESFRDPWTPSVINALGYKASTFIIARNTHLVRETSYFVIYKLWRKAISLSINSVFSYQFFMYNVWGDRYWHAGRRGPLPVIFLLHHHYEHSLYCPVKLEIMKLLVGLHFFSGTRTRYMWYFDIVELHQ